MCRFAGPVRRARRSRFDTCHQTSAPPTISAASQTLPVPGQNRRFREREERAEGEQADADEQPGVLAVPTQRLDGDRLVGALVRDHEVRREVQQQARAARQRQRREGDPVDDRVDVEVAAEPGADAAEPAAVTRPDEPPRGRLVVNSGFWSIVSDMWSLSSWMMLTASIPPARSGIGHHPCPTLIFPGVSLG